MIEHEQPQHTIAQVVEEIADEPQETEPGPRIRISKVVNLLGRTASLDLLRKTKEIETTGGMMITSGKRRKTPDGVWFYLARGTMTPEQRLKVWPPRDWKEKKKNKK